MAELSDNVSDEERLKIREICDQYLTGVWSDAKDNSFIIKRFVKGFVNKIFYCELNEDRNGDKVKVCDPVVVKFAKSEDFFLYNPLNTVINCLVLSEKRLAPKTLAIFPYGFVNEYIESRSYTHSDDYNPSTVSLLARKLAKFHSIKPPIIKDSSQKWLKIVFDAYFEEESWANNFANGKLRDAIVDNEHKTLKTTDFGVELKFIRDAIVASDSVIVFSHSDFNRGNILVQENQNSMKIFFIDFDYSANNYRGIDIGRYFSSWRHIDSNFGSDGFPTDEEMSDFLDAYIDESIIINGNSYSNSELNSKQNLIKEAKLFTLCSLIIDVLFCLWMASNNDQNIDQYLAKGETRLAFYALLKEKFQSEKSLPLGFN